MGIDFSEKMIERGKKLYPNLTFEIMEKGKVKYYENTFDAIIILAVLTCIITDDEQMELLNEIRRILKPDGIIYINDFLLNIEEFRTPFFE